MLSRGLRRQGWAEISDYEIRKGGASYTIETVRTWNQIAPRTDLFWIMGSDQWKMLPTWKEPRELGEKLRFLVFPRPERPRPLKGFEMMEIPLRIDISATEIRQRIRKKLSLEGLLLPGVEFLVQKHRWYG